MCGIAGAWGSRPTSEEWKLVDRMMASLAHRGPDADGKLASEHGTLGHRRLAIMDPAGGDQPIRADAGRAIVGNGEIYNFRDIRRRLAKRYRFHTESDTEAALHLYDDVGVELPAMLDGMFALVIVDAHQLYAARDPLGIKPLYFADHEGRLLFASELKAFPATVSRAHAFPAGTWFHSETGFRRYYALPEHEPTPPSSAHSDGLVSSVRGAIEDAVRKRLMSDVPVGAFLSGGLDSSIVTAIARRHVAELHTFSVGFAGSEDLEAARHVSRVLDTVHHEYILSEKEILTELPEILYHLESFDLDLVRSAIPCYFTARLASDYTKVILTGEGADELFAGYAYYQGYVNQAGTLQAELRRSVASMHDINLQRVDRMTMAHGVEGRVPFLDLALIDIAFGVPPELKLRRAGGSTATEKWILRRACDDLLPDEILWRRKAQFDEGSGTADRMGAILAEYVADAEPAASFTAAAPHPHGVSLRNPEERVYFDVFMRQFSNPGLVASHVSRWDDASSRL